VARPTEEHITVEGYCEPIFTSEQMAEVRRVAAEIERTPSRALASQHLLSGLVFCTCGTKMYGISQYVNTKLGRYRTVYYRCRRAANQGTCSAKQIPASVVEPLLIGELWKLRLDPKALGDMAGEASQVFEEQMRPLLKRQEEGAREIQRIARRLEALLELAEERLIAKPEYAARRAQLEAELDTLRAAHAEVERDIAARAQPGAELRGVLATLERLLDVFESLEDIGDRRRLLQQCLSRVVVRQEALEVHVISNELIIPPDEATEGANAAPKVPRKVHSARLEGHPDTAKKGEFRGRIPAEVLPANGKSTGASERMGVPAVFMVTVRARAPARNPWSLAIKNA
jgi:recombinase-like zinc beta ribbon protein